MARRLFQNAEPVRLVPWRVSGQDLDGHEVTGLILAAPDAQYWEVREASEEWAVRSRFPARRWYDAVVADDPGMLALAGDLVPGQMKIIQHDWSLGAPVDFDSGESASSKQRERTIRGSLLGIVVNPKKMHPALAVYMGDYVHILRMDKEGFPDEGQGNYEERCHDDFSEQGYGWPCQTTGCVRVHTAYGVKEKSGGYGTALYTALVLGAHLPEVTEIDQNEDIETVGCISSGDVEGGGRSGAARKWWAANSPPNRDYAQAFSKEDETHSDDEDDEEQEEYAENEVDLTDELQQYVLGRMVEGDADDPDVELEGVDLTTELKRFVRGRNIGDYDDEVTYVNTIEVDLSVEEGDDGEKYLKVSNVREINVDVRGHRPVEDSSSGRHYATGNYNVLKYSAALKAGLIVAEMVNGDESYMDGVHPDRLWQHIQNDSVETGEVYLNSILALDVRDLTLDAMNVLGILAQKGGASERQLAHLRLRWELKLDPNAAVRQLHLLPNPQQAGAAAAIEETQAARRKLGWDKWADDDVD
jgi:hypothetical protein